MPLPRITVEGRVVADPELRFGTSGVAICRVRLVASDRRKNEKSGDWEDGDVLWITATCFKQLAEHVAESVAKNDLLLVTGRIRTDEWTTDAGEKKSAVSLTADSVAVSLQWRTVPHGEARVQRSSTPQPDPWSSNATDEPPF